MREHLGVDVDAMYEEDLMAAKPQKPQHDQQVWDPDQEEKDRSGVTHFKPKKSTLGVGSAIVEGMPPRVRVDTFFPLIHRQPEAVDTLGDIVHTDAGKVIRKVIGENDNLESLESETGDKSLGEERTMESRDHQKVHGFPSSIVPTMEEKVVMDTMDSIPEDSGSSKESKFEEGNSERLQKPRSEGAHESRDNTSSPEWKNQAVKANGDTELLETKRDHNDLKTPISAKSFRDTSASSSTFEARVGDGELYGAPADASRDPKTDDQPPHAISGKNDATETEEKAVHARAEIRRHLSTKFNPKAWTLPTSTPKVDPHGFEDPISDEFWKKVWMACAVHNVKALVVIRCRVSLRFFSPLPDRDLSQSLSRRPRRSRHYLEAVQGFHTPP